MSSQPNRHQNSNPSEQTPATGNAVGAVAPRRSSITSPNTGAGVSGLRSRANSNAANRNNANAGIAGLVGGNLAATPQERRKPKPKAGAGASHRTYVPKSQRDGTLSTENVQNSGGTASSSSSSTNQRNRSGSTAGSNPGLQRQASTNPGLPTQANTNRNFATANRNRRNSRAGTADGNNNRPQEQRANQGAGTIGFNPGHLQPSQMQYGNEVSSLPRFMHDLIQPTVCKFCLLIHL